MKINQVAELAGMTSKNIRFYEDQGLITPGRDPQNGYREYTLDDAEQLGRIRLLRQLGISCADIRRLQSGELNFDTCMHEHMKKLGREGENIEHMKELCRLLSDEVNDISEIKSSVYLEKMKELEKGGVRFVNVKMSDVNRKRRTGAILSAIAIIVIVVLLIGAVVWANSEDPAPWGIFIFLMIIFGGIIAGVIVALLQRLGEVKKGEIDEASKY